ncbi:MAG TPA: MbtH family NRPS accessory protein [Caldilineaceae bacterium]|nr:MbtH family NRPS accessory protein [Caldilineaceae bacterium]
MSTQPVDGGDNYGNEHGDDYAIVVNHEGQYAIWPLNRPLPFGWTVTKQTGSLEECLALIKLLGPETLPPRKAARRASSG